jgi:prepilin-type N-terminal cleavage/methylation domain-containing protein
MRGTLRANRRRGFTLVEVVLALAVFAVVAVAVSLGLSTSLRLDSVSFGSQIEMNILRDMVQTMQSTANTNQTQVWSTYMNSGTSKVPLYSSSIGRGFEPVGGTNTTMAGSPTVWTANGTFLGGSTDPWGLSYKTVPSYMTAEFSQLQNARLFVCCFKDETGTINGNAGDIVPSVFSAGTTIANGALDLNCDGLIGGPISASGGIPAGTLKIVPAQIILTWDVTNKVSKVQATGGSQSSPAAITLGERTRTIYVLIAKTTIP